MADILIVDDVAENLHLLQLILKSESHSVRAATSAQVALNLVNKRHPDLVITDIKMPVMSGIEFCKIIKSKDELKHIPVIFVSAQTDTDNIVQALQAGGVDYLTKPFKPAEIVARVTTQIKLMETHNLRIYQELSQAINQMVIGVAHEINTPLGTSITAISYLKSIIESMQNAFDRKTLSIDSLGQIINESQEGISLCEINLGRVAEFVNLLKTISKTKGPLKPIEIDLKLKIKELCSFLNGQFDGVDFELNFELINDLYLTDFELISIVITNLVKDSYCHGFSKGSGKISISLADSAFGLEMIYKDNGIGLQNITTKELLKPFYTSKRGTGEHVGLSAPMVANIINGAFKGRYTITDSSDGLQWKINLPVVLTQTR